MGFSFWGLAIAAVGFGGFALLLLARWRGRLAALPLLVAVMVSALWAVSAALTRIETGWLWPQQFYAIMEPTRYAAWAAVLFLFWKPVLNAEPDRLALFRHLHWALWALPVVVVSLLPFDAASLTQMLGVPPVEALMLSGALIGLVLTEQIYRRTRTDLRWAIKTLCLGIGGVFAFDFYLYSDALLFRRFDADIEATRGYVLAMVLPLLFVTVARNPKWTLDVFISRRMVLRSITVVGAGGYLLLMALVGYLIRATGTSYAAALQIVFLCAAVLGLLLLAGSGRVRAQVRVFITKHFFQYQYDYREEWLALMQTLSDDGQALHVRAVKALADIADSPGGRLWIRGEHETCVFREHWCMRSDAPADLPTPLVQWLEAKQWIVDVEEFRLHPERYEGLQLPDTIAQQAHAWLLVPLFHGERLAAVVLLAAPRARRNLDWEVRDLLKTAARQVAGYLVLYDTTLALVDARQFEAFNRLSAFVVHDLKNVAAQLGLIVANAEKHKHKPAFIDDMIQTVDNATAKMQRMLTSLRKDSQTAATTGVVDVQSIIDDALRQTANRNPTPESGAAFSGQARAESERLTTVLVHLIQNAQEACAGQGEIRVFASGERNDVLIKIMDNGPGMDAAFVRERLFRPFDTTKGNAGMGLGCYQARETVRSFGGELTVDSTPGQGSCFTLRLARADAEQKD